MVPAIGSRWALQIHKGEGTCLKVKKKLVSRSQYYYFLKPYQDLIKEEQKRI